jgi:ATP-dependent Clp protease adaptor protein ClpS
MSFNPKHKEEVDILDKTESKYHLVLYNDDINTFDWVILTLVQICKHTYVQAEQCAWIVHHKGKCSVKNGEFDELNMMKIVINKRGIEAKVEKL